MRTTSGDGNDESGDGSGDVREQDHFELEAKDLQLDIQNLRCECKPGEASVSEGGDMNQLENTIKRSSLQPKHERKEGTELE